MVYATHIVGTRDDKTTPNSAGWEVSLDRQASRVSVGLGKYILSACILNSECAKRLERNTRNNIIILLTRAVLITNIRI